MNMPNHSSCMFMKTSTNRSLGMRLDQLTYSSNAVYSRERWGGSPGTASEVTWEWRHGNGNMGMET